MLLHPQVLDVGTTLATPGEHEGHLHEHLAPIVTWHSLAGALNARRECRPESQLVGQTAQRVQANVRHHALPTGFHLHATACSTVHL
jgi:hypothetical protein